MYKVVQAPPRGGAASAGPRLRPVLEEMPKWPALRQIVMEIQEQRAHPAASVANDDGAHAASHTAGRGTTDVCTGNGNAQAALFQTESAAIDGQLSPRAQDAQNGASASLPAKPVPAMQRTSSAILIIANETHMLTEVRSVLQARSALQDLIVASASGLTGSEWL